MPREYRHIKQYENELLKLKADGLTHREIGEKLGFEQSKVKKFFERYRIKNKVLYVCIFNFQSAGRSVPERSQEINPFTCSH